MVLHVCQRAVDAGAEQIIVATDDDRIKKTVEEAGYLAIMTNPDHPSGTDRIAEVVISEEWSDQTLIINIQGDEPLVSASNILTLANTLESQTKADVATISTAICNTEELFDTNIVKVVTDNKGYALYFSRSTIPWDRDGFAEKTITQTNQHQRHLGLYAYRAAFLKRFITMQVSPIETLEKLEQLRMLWNAEPIIVASVSEASAIGVDTPEDLLRVEKIIMQNQQLSSST